MSFFEAYVLPYFAKKFINASYLTDVTPSPKNIMSLVELSAVTAIVAATAPATATAPRTANATAFFPLRCLGT